MVCPIIDLCITRCKIAFVNKGILILVTYISEFFIFCTRPTTIKALELGSYTRMDYVYFVLTHTVVVVYTTWFRCLEDESLIYTMLDYLFHIVEYVVFPILDLICVDFYNKKNSLSKAQNPHTPPPQ